MKLCEIWKDFEAGKWIQRSAWKKTYAVRLCNYKCSYTVPILMIDTEDFVWHFGGMQTGRHMRKTAHNHQSVFHGLQYDLLADDWKLADQTKCDMMLAEHEK
jgi:hypothetical protein